MARKADFRAKAALTGVDDLNVPWSRALKRAERRAGRSFSKIERMGMRAHRGIRRGFARAGTELQGVGRAAGVARKGFGALAKTGGVLGVGLGLAVDKAGKFELEVARLGNLLEAGVDPVAEYGDLLQDMAVRFGTDPIEAAQAAYMAFSGGVETSKDALKEFLPVALKASKAGFAEPAVVVDALTSALNTFKDSGITAAEIANKLFVTEALGKTDFAQIAASIGDVAGFANSLGVSLDGILAPMASITKEGKTTSAAFTQMRALLTGVAGATGKFKKEFKKIGVPFGPDAIRSASDMVEWVTQLKKAVDVKGTGILFKLFGRQEARNAAIRLTTTGFEDLINITDGLGNSATALGDNWDNVQKRMGFRIQQFKQGFSVLVDSLGSGIAEGIGFANVASEDVPAAINRASRSVRQGAAGFASAFVGALVPANELADMDWQRFAVSAGRAFGEVASAIGKVAVAAANLINTAAEVKSAWDDAREGVDRTEEAAKRVGSRTIERTTLAEELYQLGPIGNEELRRSLQEQLNEQAAKVGAAIARGDFGRVGALTGTGAGRGVGMHAAGRARKRQRARQPVVQTAAAGLGAGLPFAGMVPTDVLAEVVRKSFAFDPRSRTGVMGQGRTEVGGEVKVTIEDKTGGTKEVSAEVVTKNPKVPVRASVGKRRTGT